MMLLAGETVTLEQTLLALVADKLAQLEWRMFDGRAATWPKSILAALRGRSEEDAGAVQAFDSPEAFDAAMAAFRGGEEHGD